jgi:uncharacterized protein YabE (DUF348 family)
MNSPISKYPAISLGAILTAIVCLIAALFLIISNVVSAEPAGVDDTKSRLITFHDRGQKKVIISTASNIKDALKEADIAVDTYDVVEPGLQEQLVNTDYQVNIYRARPVVVIDGESKQKVMTAYQTAERIAKDAGVELHEKDTLSLDRSADITGEGAGLNLTVERAQKVSLVVNGVKTIIRTQTDTVGDLLSENSIELSEPDTVEPSTETQVNDEMTIEVWREGKSVITAEESINFETEIIQDANRLTGYESVQTKGKKGTKTVVYEILIKDGKEVSRSEVVSVVNEHPRNQVEVVGIKSAVTYTGGKDDWLKKAGIPESDWGYIDFILSSESGWNPTVWNTTGSGAYGLCQSLPASKMASAGSDYMTNPVTQLRWCNSYAMGRYGSWENAYNFWTQNHWW